MDNFATKNIPPLTPEQIAELEYLHNMKDEDIDYSDIPEITHEEFVRMIKNSRRRKKLQRAS